MAESLSAEQLEERRTNLRAFRKMLEMDDDADLTTTLIMQEEWLATVDELQGYVRDALTLRGIRTRKCLLSDSLGGGNCTDFWKNINLYCAPCYMRAIHKSGGTEPDLPATSLKVDPDAFAPLPLHGVVLDDPGGTEPPLRSLGLTPEEATKLVSDGDEPAPRPLQEWTEKECETTGQAHVWVKVGTAGLTDKGLSAMDWGDPKCLRCGIPEPEKD